MSPSRQTPSKKRVIVTPAIAAMEEPLAEYELLEFRGQSEIQSANDELGDFENCQKQETPQEECKVTLIYQSMY
jgi:hypothetical protein